MAKKSKKTGVIDTVVINGNHVSINSIFLKKPFIIPAPVYDGDTYTDGSLTRVRDTFNTNRYYNISQSTFLNQYYPSGHKINDPNLDYWKDVYGFSEKDDIDKDTGQPTGKVTREYKEHKLQRRSFGLQQIGVRQILSMLTGNSIDIRNSAFDSDNETQSRLAKLKQGWVDGNIDNSVYDFLEGILAVGDSALEVLPDDNNENVKCKSYSYLKGDTLIPHYNISGDMDYFVRIYNDIYTDIISGEDRTIKYVDIIDKNNKYIYIYEGGSLTYVDSIVHLRGYVPIAYGRIDMPIYSLVQDNIDSFEFLMSMLSENNLKSAFRTLCIKTSGQFQIESGYNGGMGLLLLDSDDKSDAKFLEKPDISNSFELELKNIYQNILTGMGIVLPENRTSGDTPVGTSKLRYSSAIEISAKYSRKIDKSIEMILMLFKSAFGSLNGNNPTDYESLKVNGSIKIYTVIDDTEHNNMLLQAYMNGAISHETYCEKSTIAANDETFRVKKEDAFIKMNDAENNGGI